MSFDIKKVARPRPFAVLEKPDASKASETVRRAPKPEWKPPLERWRAWAAAGERLALILAAAGSVLFFASGRSAAGLAVWLFFVALFVWLSAVDAVFLAPPLAPPLARGGVVARQLALLVFLAATAFLVWSAWGLVG